MEDQLILFETAKLAKEKGLSYKDLSSFEGSWLCYQLNYPKYKPNWFSGYFTGHDTQNFNTLLLAPTQSLLQKWLREVHNIHIIIVPPGILKIEKSYVSIHTINQTHTIWFNPDKWISYEESLEKGLLQALKLI
jgi:hypothetical protein